MRAVLFNILSLFDFILLLCIVLIAMGLVLRHIIKRFNINEYKIKLYGIFMNLGDLSILAICSSIIRYIFILWCVIGCSNFNIIHLIFLITISLITNLCVFNLLGFIFDMFSSLILYFSFIICSLLLGYLNDVRFEWYVLTIAVLLIIFIFIYATYFLLKTVNDIVSKNKYIRRKKK
jgi:hypothetical protein